MKKNSWDKIKIDCFNSHIQSHFYNLFLLLQHLKLLWRVKGRNSCGLSGTVVGTQGVDTTIASHCSLATVTVSFSVWLIVLTWQKYSNKNTPKIFWGGRKSITTPPPQMCNCGYYGHNRQTTQVTVYYRSRANVLMKHVFRFLEKATSQCHSNFMKRIIRDKGINNDNRSSQNYMKKKPDS